MHQKQNPAGFYTKGEEIFNAAVSYTHLDVYKRQAQVHVHGPGEIFHIVQLFGGDIARRGVKNGGDAVHQRGAGAVSYTHLDVYKRQALSCHFQVWGQ